MESDSAASSEGTDGEEAGRACESDDMERVDVTTWNIDGMSRCGASRVFLEDTLQNDDVALLQEVKRRVISKQHIGTVI